MDYPEKTEAPAEPQKRKTGRPKLPPGEAARRRRARDVARMEREKIERAARREKKNAKKPATPPAQVADDALPDTDLFGRADITPPPKLAPDAPAPAPAAADPATPIPPPKPAPDAAAPVPTIAAADFTDHRPIATMLFQAGSNLLAQIFGPWWLPRKVGSNAAAGEIPFDESETVVSALTKYFKSIGMAILSPVQELYCALGMYALPRLPLTVQAWKVKRTAVKQPTKPAETAPAQAAPPPLPQEKKEPTAPPPSAHETELALAQML